MVDNLKSAKDGEPMGTDAEACAYLMTVSLTQPIDSDWTQIYLYVAGQTCKRWNKNEVPADINVETISDYQTGELNRLKEWIYRTRVNGRLQKDRADRKEAKEDAEAQKKAEQPALFEF
jgi:hypothetical protein